MRTKLAVVAALVIALVCGFGVAGVFADHGCMDKKGGWDLGDKIHDKAMMMMAHEDDLGLTDEQVKKIKDLKHKVMKEMITKDAEIDVIAVDIKSAMWEDPIDTEAVNKLLEKKYDLKKAEAMSAIAALADLQDILTKEQKDKMKAIMKEHKKAMMCCPMMGGKCPMMSKGMKPESTPGMSHKN